MTSTTIDRLRELRQSHLDKVKQCDDAIALLLDIDRQERRATKLVASVHGHAAASFAYEPAPDGRRGPRPNPDARYGTAVIEARRARTAAILADFDRTEVRPSGEHRKALGSLVRSGYLKKKSGGYLRTAKPYSVSVKARLSKARSFHERHPAYNTREATKARREQTAALLATFDTTEVRPVPEGRGGGGIGPLMRGGYLKKRRNGYLRTEKPFEVWPAKFGPPQRKHMTNGSGAEA